MFCCGVQDISSITSEPNVSIERKGYHFGWNEEKSGAAPCVLCWASLSWSISNRSLSHRITYCKGLGANCFNLRGPKLLPSTRGLNLSAKWWMPEPVRGEQSSISYSQGHQRSMLIECFNGKFRDDCLNEDLFCSLEGGRRKIEKWRENTMLIDHIGPSVIWTQMNLKQI